jgi:DNA-binding transcriptional regulator GbsR (MarR family)
MNTKLELAQHKFMEGIGKLCDSFGLNKFIAQLYALLYLSNRPLSLDDMTEMLEVSKGTVSLNIRELEKWGAVRSVWVKGSRKDYYEANLDVKKVVAQKMRSGAQKRIQEISRMIDEFKSITQSAAPELSEEERNIANIYEERLKKIEELNALASNAMSLADKLL